MFYFHYRSRGTKRSTKFEILRHTVIWPTGVYCRPLSNAVTIYDKS